MYQRHRRRCARCARSTPRRSCAAATSRWTRPRRALDDFSERLQRVLDEVRDACPVPELSALPVPEVPADAPAPETGVARGDAACASPRATTRGARGVQRPPQARAPVRPARARWSARARSTGRSAEALAIGSLLARGRRRAPGRPGHAPGHVLPAPRGAHRLRHRRAVRPARAPGRGRAGCFTVRDSLLSEYAALGFEYGYSVEAPRTPGRVGGAVRRLRQRRRDHHRQLPRRRRGQVGPAAPAW